MAAAHSASSSDTGTDSNIAAPHASASPVGPHIRSVFDAIPFEQRITHPGTHGFPDATFDYFFSKNVEMGKPIITQSNVSDHLPVTCDVTIQ